MRLLAAVALVLLSLGALQATIVLQSREEMLNYYYSSVDGKIPKSARMLIGDEKINVYVSSQAIGIETTRGELSSFETYPVAKPTIVVRVSDTALERLSARKTGLLALVDTGEIRIEPKTLLSALKVEAMKRIYAVSGADRQLFSSPSAPQAPNSFNSLYVQRTRIEN